MGWRPILESAEEKSEFMLRFLFAHPQGAKHFFLQIPLIDPYGAATDLIPVQHNIISIGLNPAITRGLIHPGDMFRLRRSKRMVPGHPSFFLLRVFKQGEIYYP